MNRRAIFTFGLASCLVVAAACTREPVVVDDQGTASATTSSGSGGRDTIRIVGSSTVYPFSAAVAERFGRAGNKTPVIESTGTGGGFKLFCGGVGIQHPDITNASRAIKGSESEQCQQNGVGDVLEVPIGYDGIVIATSTKGERLALTRRQLFVALAKEVPTADGQLAPNPTRPGATSTPHSPPARSRSTGRRPPRARATPSSSW
jgi:phosphate transport system substrate-binding protein